MRKWTFHSRSENSHTHTHIFFSNEIESARACSLLHVKQSPKKQKPLILSCCFRHFVFLVNIVCFAHSECASCDLTEIKRINELNWMCIYSSKSRVRDKEETCNTNKLDKIASPSELKSALRTCVIDWKLAYTIRTICAKFVTNK